jgi:SAM-dependent methyltransferase
VVRAQTTTRTVVDPFCGFGTVLAVANALGLDAIGVDRSKRMCQRARRLRLSVPLGSGRPDQGPGNSPSAQLRPDGEAGKVKLAGSEPLGKDASTEMNQFVADVGQL